MPELLLEEPYRARQQAALDRVRSMRMSVTELAKRIGRVRQWTSQVLNGSRYSEETLSAIEVLLEDVQTGRVEVG